MKYLLLFCLSLSSCYAGNIGSSNDTTDSSVDNSVDNSISGVSSCTVGTSFECVETGLGSFEVTEECMNADGSPVVINGPEEMSFCPVEDEIEEIEEVSETEPQIVDGGGLNQGTPTS